MVRWPTERWVLRSDTKVAISDSQMSWLRPIPGAVRAEDPRHVPVHPVHVRAVEHAHGALVAGGGGPERLRVFRVQLRRGQKPHARSCDVLESLRDPRNSKRRRLLAHQSAGLMRSEVVIHGV